jgi:hypothetical protein
MAYPQQVYAAPQAMASPVQETRNTLGFSVVRLPIPTLKFYAVPKPQQAQMVTIQQAPMAPMMMAPPMMSPMMAPQMMAPQVMAAPQAAPACPSTDAAQTALMMALLQQSQRNAAPVPAAPGYDDSELETKAKKIEDRIDALTNALENSK